MPLIITNIGISDIFIVPSALRDAENYVILKTSEH